MKKECYLVVLTLILFSCLINTAKAALGPNLAKDPGFEEYRTYWNGGSFDHNVVYEGNVSAKMIGDPESHWVTMTQELPLKNGKEYLINIWCRVKGTGAVKIGIRSITASGSTFTYQWKNIPTSIQEEWFEYETRITTTRDRNAVRFQIYLLLEYFTGEVWFDNFSIQEDDNTPPNPPQKLVYERSSGGTKLSWIEPEMALDSDIAEGGYRVYRSATEEKLGAPESFVEHIFENYWEDKFSGRYGYFYCITSLDTLLNESAKTAVIYVPGVGSLSGYIFDNQGLPVANARISIGDHTVTSYADGYYKFEQLPEGVWEVKVSKPGFRWEITTIEVVANNDLKQNFTIISDRTKPLEPENLKAIHGEGFIGLEWLPPIILGNKRIAGYNIYKADVAEFDAKPEYCIAQLWKKTQWVDTNVIHGKEYWYFVTAVDDAGNESKASNRVQGISLYPPKLITIGPQPDESFLDEPIVFEWEKLNNASNYIIELSRDKTFPPAKTTVINTNSDENSYIYYRTIRYIEGGKEQILKVGLPDGEWYWRVYGVLANDIKSYPSEPVKIISFNSLVRLDEVAPKEYFIEDLKKSKTLSIPYYQIFPPALTNNAPMNIEYVINSDDIAFVEVRVVNSGGKKVATLFEGEVPPNQKHVLEWEGRDDNGRYLNNGLYLIQIVLFSEEQSTSAAKRVVIFR